MQYVHVHARAVIRFTSKKPSCTVQGSVKAGAKPVIHPIDVCTCFSYMICNNSAVLHHGNLTALVHDYVKSFLKKVVRFSIF